ncbi:alpha/beta hydrolase family protein [Kutzneria albida]|uniref:Uncharacterized protein n=1 Tax=Kutzneria albida DSM 43870 TaxID=1449976 RepID=W5WUJ7_9PSEU|nr:alpha/beta fold hydrolase [Kutzneria albida]AHI01825.1 hypothetical protein KALB_8468 [Kutzneria albida DSM 43870]
MRKLFFEQDETFWYETLRSIGHITYGGADFGEVVVTADRIVAGDYDSWHREWLATADKVAGEAAASLAGGHRVSARRGFMRAANYYRSAEFFLHGTPEDPRIEAAYDRSVQCWRAALELFDTPARPVRIPFEGTTLSGYLYLVDDSGLPRPTVIVNNGFDGTAEETYFLGAGAALERGYNVLTFDGPGQGEAIHKQGLHFRTNWESVLGPVIDFAQSLSEVDGERIALYGISMSGLLAPRAAAYEPRIKAVIAFDGVYDMAEMFTARIGMDREQVLAMLRAESAPEVDTALEELIKNSSTMRWAISHGQWVTGTASPRQFLAAFCEYTLADGVAELVSCPTLVCSAASDGFFSGQPEQLYQHLTCEKRLVEFTVEEGADEHCQSGAAALAGQRIYDWLDEVL